MDKDKDVDTCIPSKIGMPNLIGGTFMNQAILSPLGGPWRPHAWLQSCLLLQCHDEIHRHTHTHVITYAHVHAHIHVPIHIRIHVHATLPLQMHLPRCAICSRISMYLYIFTCEIACDYTQIHICRHFHVYVYLHVQVWI